MKRGFTLVELVATLIVLAIVAIIVVPNIFQNIREAQEAIYKTQIEAIEDAAQNWVVDNPDKLPENNDVTYVFLQDLIGYIGEVDKETGDIIVHKDNNGNNFNPNVFVLIKSTVVQESENSFNYKYSYEVYDTNEKHLIYLASLYAKENNVTNQTVTLSDLIVYADSNLRVESSLKNIEDGTLINSATVLIEYNNGEYSYTVNID